MLASDEPRGLSGFDSYHVQATLWLRKSGGRARSVKHVAWPMQCVMEVAHAGSSLSMWPGDFGLPGKPLLSKYVVLMLCGCATQGTPASLGHACGHVEQATHIGMVARRGWGALAMQVVP